MRTLVEERVTCLLTEGSMGSEDILSLYVSHYVLIVFKYFPGLLLIVHNLQNVMTMNALNFVK